MENTKTTAVAKTQKQGTIEVSYKLSDGQVITLTEAAVRNLTNNNELITDGEIQLFIETCKYLQLNPYIKEIFLIKYDGSKPAQNVIAVATLKKIADGFPDYEGIESGIVVQTADGKIVDRIGCIRLDKEILVGAWATVSRTKRIPTRKRIGFKEFTQGQATWNKMPAYMINKVAEAIALRSAYPSQFSGVYAQEELGVDEKNIINNDDNNEPTYDIEPTTEKVAQENVNFEGVVVENIEPEGLPEVEGFDDVEEEIQTIPYSKWTNELKATGKWEQIKNSYNSATKTVKVRKKTE